MLGIKYLLPTKQTKKLSKAAKAWRKASMDCFAENGKARRKVSKHVKKLRKCSRNLTLSRELLKASKKKKFRNGDGEKKSGEKAKDFYGTHDVGENMLALAPGNVVTDKNDAALRHCVVDKFKG